MLKRSIILAVTLLGITSFTQVAGAAAPTDSGLLSDIPYLETFYRYGQPLIKKRCQEKVPTTFPR